MVTAEDTSNRPMAISSGFRSGFASATIFPNDDALDGGPFRKEVRLDNCPNIEK